MERKSDTDNEELKEMEAKMKICVRIDTESLKDWLSSLFFPVFVSFSLENSATVP